MVRAVRVGEFCSCLGLVVGLEMEMVAVVVIYWYSAQTK